MGHVQSGNIIVVSLPSPDSGEGVEVIKSFQMGGNVVHGRVIAGKKRRRNGRKNDPVIAEEDNEMEVDAVPDDEDKEEEREGEDKEDDDEDGEKEEVKEEVKVEEEQSWISCLGASGDGQWLVSGDTAGRVTIFNLDTLQVSQSFF